MKRTAPKRRAAPKPELSDPAAFARLEREVARRKAAARARNEEPKGAPRGEFKTAGAEIKVAMERISKNVVATMEATAEQEEGERRKKRGLKWNALRCPAKFRETFDHRKSRAQPDSINAVLEWRFGPLGLFIVGETGRSKTWALWVLLTRLYVEEGRRVIAMDGMRFANEAALAYSEQRQEQWLRPLVEAPVLAVDDLAKRFTPAAQQAWFTVADRRAAALRPVLATSNLTADELRALINDRQMSEPMLRRMRENCQVVVF